MGLGKTYSAKYLLDSNNNSGVAGQLLSTTASGIDWVDANTVPGAGLWLENGNDIYNSNSGNVGIGITGPGTKLQVANAGEVIVRSSMTAADGFRGGFEADNQHTGGTIWSMFSTNSSDGYFGGGKFVIANESMGGVDANTTAQVVIDGSANVGIGIIPGNGFGLARLSLGTGAVANEIISFASASGGNAEFRNTSSTGTFTFCNSDGSSEQMRINALGNVGIGTTSVSERLVVDETTTNVLDVARFRHNQSSVVSNVIFENSAGGNDTGFNLSFKTGSSGFGGVLGVIRTNSPDAGDSDMFLSSGGGKAITILHDGNVGIGGTLPASLLSAYGTASTNLTALTTDTAVNGTGGGNRGFDTSFTGATTTGFTGTDSGDQGYGYFGCTIVSGTTYVLHFLHVSVNGSIKEIITASGTNFASNTVQTLSAATRAPSGQYSSIKFTATASATFIGFGALRTSGTMSLTMSEVALIEGVPDLETGSLVAYKSLIVNGKSFNDGPYLPLTAGSTKPLTGDLYVQSKSLYITGGNQRIYMSGGSATNYRGVEVSSTGLWSWGETGIGNYFSKDVGIGLTLPQSELHVNGGISVGPSSTRSEISGPTGGNANMTFAANAGNVNTGIAEFIFTNSLTGSATRVERMRIESDGKIQIGNNIPMWSGSYGGALFLKGNNVTGDRYSQLTEVDSTGAITQVGLVVKAGSVGVGITSPVEKLDTPNIAIGGSTITGYTANKLRIDNNGGTSRFYSTGANTTTKGQYVFHVTSSNGSLNPEIMRISSAGNVGIGTTDPGASKLMVVGSGNYNTLKITNTETANVNKQTGICSLNYIGNSTSIMQYATNPGANVAYYGSADGGFRGLTQHSFMVSSGADTVSHAETMAISSAKITMSADVTMSGSVGIGETALQRKFNLYDGTDTWTRVQCGASTADWLHGIAGSNHTYLWYNQSSNGGAGNKMGLATSGTLTVSGDLIAYGSPSDKRLKENIKPIESALDKVSKLQGVTFDWIQKEDQILDIKEDIGFIAQDVQKVIPELVRENEDGMLSMRHQGIAPILLEAIKELKAEIEELKKKIK